MASRKRKIVYWAVPIMIGLSLTGYMVFNTSQQKPSTRKTSTPPSVTTAIKHVTVCSFNIQFLGQSKERDDNALAYLLRDYDVVVVQELVAPPYPMNFPDGSAVTPDPQAQDFFDRMGRLGFKYVLSEEDTGPIEKIHNNGPGTEWWVAFYKAAIVSSDTSLPTGFLADDRSNNADYDRVPYAFGFRTPEGHLDFVLISVHLKPGDLLNDRARRKHELATISTWVGAHNAKEKDFIVLGDMNIEDAKDLAEDVPQGLVSLNAKCSTTNTNVRSPKPYDHVLFSPKYSTEVDQGFGFYIINLVEAMRSAWKLPEPYPGDPYNHDRFRARYSDHNPIVFRLDVPDADDD